MSTAEAAETGMETTEQRIQGGEGGTDRRAPVNTASQVDRNPLSFLFRAMTEGTPDAITGQEAQGQRSFAESDTLPANIRGGRGETDAEARERLEAMGVRIGPAVEGDDLFVYADLPDGWERRPTEHSMWSDLVDGGGRKVASIFYKAAFYDRDAFLDLSAPPDSAVDHPSTDSTED